LWGGERGRACPPPFRHLCDNQLNTCTEVTCAMINPGIHYTATFRQSRNWNRIVDASTTLSASSLQRVFRSVWLSVCLSVCLSLSLLSVACLSVFVLSCLVCPLPLHVQSAGYKLSVQSPFYYPLKFSIFTASLGKLQVHSSIYFLANAISQRDNSLK